MLLHSEIARLEVDSGVSEMSEVDLVGAAKVLRLFFVYLSDRTMVHMDIGTLEGNEKVEGETTLLYQHAIEEMKIESERSGVPIQYQFLSSDERMIWFGNNVLQLLLGDTVVKENEDNLLRLTWQYPN